MIVGVRKPCLDCGALTVNSSRCDTCRLVFNRLLDSRRDKSKRKHYSGDYKARAKAVREAAVTCWICGEEARPHDPWQADHVVAGDPESLLLPAHRSCNIRRTHGGEKRGAGV